MKKLSKAQLRTWALGHLRTKQNGLCPLCGRPIETGKQQGNKTDYVVDHNHITGEIRAVLHRSCNRVEGIVFQGVGRWGAGGLDYEKVVPFTERLVEYWKCPGTGLMYPTHKTAEESKAAALQKRRTAYARKKAAQKVRAESTTKEQ